MHSHLKIAGLFSTKISICDLLHTKREPQPTHYTRTFSSKPMAILHVKQFFSNPTVLASHVKHTSGYKICGAFIR
jgi:hypothetical protein